MDEDNNHKRSQVINSKLSPIELQKIQEKILVEGVIKNKLENNKARLRKFVKQGIQGNSQMYKQEVKRELSPLVLQRAYEYNPSKTMRTQTKSSSGSRPSCNTRNQNHYVKTVYTSLSPVRSQNSRKQNRADNNKQLNQNHRSLSLNQRNPINIQQLSKKESNASIFSSHQSQQNTNSTLSNHHNRKSNQAIFTTGDQQENIDSNIMMKNNNITPIREVEKLKILHHEEIGDLKRKLADTEKRFVLLWEHVKESGRRNDKRIQEIQQKMNSSNQKSLIQLHKQNSPLNNPTIISSADRKCIERAQGRMFSNEKILTQSPFNLENQNKDQQQLLQHQTLQQKSRNNMNNSFVTPIQTNSSQRNQYQRLNQDLQDSLLSSIQTINYPIISQDQQSSTSPMYPVQTKSSADLLSSYFSKNGMFQSMANPSQGPNLEIEEEIKQMNQVSHLPQQQQYQSSEQKQEFMSKNFSVSSIKYPQNQNNTMNSFTPIQTQENPLPCNNTELTRNSNLTINTSNSRSAYPLVSANRINYNSTNSDNQSQNHSRQNTIIDYRRNDIKVHNKNNGKSESYEKSRQDCHQRRSLNRVLSMQIMNNPTLQQNHIYDSFDQNFPMLARLEQQYLKNLQGLGNYPSRSPTSNASSLEQDPQFGSINVFSPDDSNSQKLYIVSSKWFINWFQTYSANKFFIPTKITNIDALDVQSLALKPKSIPNLDYFIINFDTWSSLMNLYGADYEIQLYKFQINIIDLNSDDSTPRHSSFLDVPNELSYYYQDNLTAIINAAKFSYIQPAPPTTQHNSKRPLSDDMTNQQNQQQMMIEQQFQEFNQIKLQNENLKYQHYQQQREESLKRDITKKNNIIYTNKQ